MGTIDQNLNWTGPLDGIIYYMRNGKQMFREEPEQKNSDNWGTIDFTDIPAACVEAAVLASSMLEALADEIKDLRSDNLQGRLTALFENIQRRHGGSGKSLGKGLFSIGSTDLFAGFEFHDPLENTPLLYAATIRRSEITFYPLPQLSDGHRLILLQINLATGAYSKFTRTLPDPEAAHPLVMKTGLLKGGYYFPFAFISGPDFLNGAMLRTP
jgi:hypothetical protein